MKQDMEGRARQDTGQDNDRIERQRFAPQQIRGRAAESPSAARPQRPPNNDYVFERGSYAPQGVEPNYHFLDSRIVNDLQEISLPFPLRKIAVNSEGGGAWYVFGTKLLLIREYDEDLLMIREYKSHSDEHFNAYIESNGES